MRFLLLFHIFVQENPAPQGDWSIEIECNAKDFHTSKEKARYVALEGWLEASRINDSSQWFRAVHQETTPLPSHGTWNPDYT